MNGFEVASYLKKWNRECCIVFVSNKDDLVFQSLVYHPFFFIRKAHLDEELETAVAGTAEKGRKESSPNRTADRASECKTCIA